MTRSRSEGRPLTLPPGSRVSRSLGETLAAKGVETGREKPRAAEVQTPGMSALAAKFAWAWFVAGDAEPPCVTEYQFDESRKWRFDFAWPERKVAVEIDGGTYSGGRHVRGKGYEGDCNKLNAAVMAGWVVLRFTGYHLAKKRQVETVGAVAKVLNDRRHLPFPVPSLPEPTETQR